MPLSRSRCTKWLSNKNINPATHRSITSSGAIFKKYASQCHSYSKGSKIIKSVKNTDLSTVITIIAIIVGIGLIIGLVYFLIKQFKSNSSTSSTKVSIAYVSLSKLQTPIVEGKNLLFDNITPASSIVSINPLSGVITLLKGSYTLDFGVFVTVSQSSFVMGIDIVQITTTSTNTIFANAVDATTRSLNGSVSVVVTDPSNTIQFVTRFPANVVNVYFAFVNIYAN
jgi:hypothetical protein